jgi:hypothetical protein
MVDNDGLGRGAKVAAREGPPVRGAEDQALEVPWDFEQFYLREYRGVVDLADATHLLHVSAPAPWPKPWPASSPPPAPLTTTRTAPTLRTGRWRP